MVTRLHVSQGSFIVLYADDILIFALSLREQQNMSPFYIGTSQFRAAQFSAADFSVFTAK